MRGIRPFARNDAPAVARLYELVVRSGAASPPPGLAAYFERTLLDHPWADAEIPSLVIEDEAGEVVAFQGSHVRRARFDGQAIRIGCAGQLVAHPRVRSRGAGAQLVNAYLQGPQELTITDGATHTMRQIWTLLGGHMAHLECVSWSLVFAPAQLVAELFKPTQRRSMGPARRALAQFDGAAQRALQILLPPPWPRVVAESLNPATMLEHLPSIVGPLRLYLDYDRPYLDWLFRETAAVGVRGRLVAQLIREPRRRRILGWYVYYLKPGGSAQVLQIAVGERDAGAVIDHLLNHAYAGGAAAVRGRIEPRLLGVLGERRSLLQFSGAALVQADDHRILDAIASGQSLLTRLDGEWWMGHHLLGFSQP